MRNIVMPLQRMQTVVAIMLTAAPTVPNPETISPPGNVGRAARSLQANAADEAVVQHQAAQRRHPEAEGVHPGEGHIPGADHQGNQVIGKSNDQRHPHKEDHGGAMHGEDAVEDLRGEKIVVGYGQLNAQ
jgi:hypothetical protein